MRIAVLCMDLCAPGAASISMQVKYEYEFLSVVFTFFLLF